MTDNNIDDLYDISCLRTGFIPDHAQSSQIERTLASLERECTALHRRIQDLTAQSPSLLSEYDTIRSTIAVHRALLAPVRRLPPEMLMEIFEFCTHGNTFCVMRSPLILTHVCYTWRQVAQRSPRLWTGIIIGLQYPNETSEMHSEPQDLTGLVDLWLQNSRSLPLDISLHPDKGPKSKKLSDIVLREFARIRTARIAGTTGYDSIVGTMNSLMKPPHWAYLSQITLEDCSPRSDWAGGFQWETPRLHTLRLNRAIYLIQVIRSCNLRRVFLKDRCLLESAKWAAFFRACPGIEELDMPLSCISHEDGSRTDESAVIDLPHLRRLSLSMEPDRPTLFAVDFMNNLRAHRIQYLEFYCPFREYVCNSTVSRAVQNLITNCSSTLEDLSWTGDFMLESGRNWLKTATELKTLSVPYKSLDLLIPESGTDLGFWTCPNLATIRILDYHCGEKKLKSVVEKRTLPDCASPMAGVHYLTGIDISELTIRNEISSFWTELVELRDFSRSHKEFSIYEDRHDRWYDRWQ